MTSRMPRLLSCPRAPLAAALVALLVLAGCGGKSKPNTAQAPTSAPTTTAAAPAVFPLTGLPAGGAGSAARPALSVKIDNVSAARPQAGLNQADLVVEQPVEGGLTRLFATWQSKDAQRIGPVRSARPVDAQLLRQLGPSLFAFAGASAGVLQVVQRNSGATLLSPDIAGGAFQRVSGRRAPHNTFSSTQALYQAGTRAKAGLGPPRAFLEFAAATPAAATRPVRLARLTFSPSARSSWQWNGKGFVRSQDGSPDRLLDGGSVSSDNVVVLSVALRADPNVDVLGNRTPDPVLTGSGRAWVLRDGRMVTGTWRRRSATSAIELLGPDSSPVQLHPGRSWIELLPSSQRPAFSG
jgi:hypothetical protein